MSDTEPSSEGSAARAGQSSPPNPIESCHTERFSMRYFRFGSGSRTMVILPGLSVTSVMAAADAIAEEYQVFRKDFTVYVMDRRTELPLSYSIAEMAADTAEVFRTLGLSDVHLFGASQGGMIAMLIAADSPDLVRKLALGSTSSCVTDRRFAAVERWIDYAKKGDSRNLYLDFGRRLYPPELFRQYRDTLVSAADAVTEQDLSRFIILAEGTRDFSAADRLGEIRCPILLLGSEDDSVLGKDAFLTLEQALNGKEGFESYLYHGYGHAAFDTAPDYRDRIFRFFLG